MFVVENTKSGRFAIGFCALLVSFLSFVQESVSQDEPSVAEDQIAKVSDKFADAFDAGDASALAKLFTKQGEFISVDQLVYRGRDQVEAEFKAAFEALPDSAINIEIDSIRMVAPGLAIEDGRATIATENGPASVSNYTSVYTKVGDEWKIASLRDLSSTAMSPGDHLISLQWLIGDWISESNEGVVEYKFYWAEKGNFILNDFTLTIDGTQELSGKQRLGWDAQSKQIRGWTFDSEGSHVKAEWTEMGDRWMIKTQGVNADGASVSSTNFYVKGDAGQLDWVSTDRIVDGKSQPDVRMKLVRRPPSPSKMLKK